MPGLAVGAVFVYCFGWIVRALPVWVSAVLAAGIAAGATRVALALVQLL